MSTLAKELDTYKRELPNLLANSGKFVLICGDEVFSTYDSYADAIKVGYEKFGLTPFLVKQISQTEQISYFSRDFNACPA